VWPDTTRRHALTKANLIDRTISRIDEIPAPGMAPDVLDATAF
jgi:hypothetical protein